MKCINNELIQKYIDGETSSQETVKIEKHLTECTQCLKKIENQKVFVYVVKNELGHVKQPVIIPDFIIPVSQKHRLYNIKVKHFIYAVSAACAILLAVFLLPALNKKNEQYNLNTVHLIYTFEGDFDSNKPMTQHEMVIKIIDSNGKIVTYN